MSLVSGLVIAVLVIVLALIIVLFIRTAIFRSKQLAPGEIISYPIDTNEAAARLSEALRFRTISSLERSEADVSAFHGLHEFMRQAFPLVHAKLERKVINECGLLFIWKGSDPGRKPILLMGHQDVVPASEEGWKYPPFSGLIQDGYVWGRGALDDKGSIMAILEAVEFLLKEGYTPKNPVYLAFGSDEEIGGYQGAAKIADYLKNQGVQFEFVLDEGSLALNGLIQGVDGWVALIGIAEKGSLSLELSTEQQGGHSMSPPDKTTVGIISAAVVKLQDNPFPLRLTRTVEQMLTYLGPEMGFLTKMTIANLWLFKPMIIKRLSAGAMKSSLQTTTAPTMSSGGPQDNVLPQRATAVVNFRLLQGDSVDSVTDRVRSLIADSRIKINTFGPCISNPSMVSPINNRAFGIISNTIREMLPGVLVSPSLLPGGTDTVHFRDIADCFYRFTPQKLTTGDLSRLHGFDERNSVDNYSEMISFYIRLFHNSCD